MILRTAAAGGASCRLIDFQWMKTQKSKVIQVDLLREGLLGTTRDDFAHRYCGRRLVPVRGSRGAAGARCYDDSGLTCGQELHGLLKQVKSLQNIIISAAMMTPGCLTTTSCAVCSRCTSDKSLSRRLGFSVCVRLQHGFTHIP